MHEKEMKAFMFLTMKFMSEHVPQQQVSIETVMAMMSSLTMFMFAGYCQTTEEMIACMRVYAEGLSNLPYERLIAECENWLRRN